MRRIVRDAAINIEAATKNISNFFRQRISKYSIAPRGLKLSIITSSNANYLRASDPLAGRETNGSKRRPEDLLMRDSFSLMTVATENRSKPNKSRSNGSTSARMNVPLLLLLSGASRTLVCVPMGMAVDCFAVDCFAVDCFEGSSDAPGPPDWQVADHGWPTHRERMMRKTN